MNWDHDRKGEAEFWLSRDRSLIAQVFGGQTAITGAELVELNRILDELGSDSDEMLLRLCHAQSCGGKLEEITARTVGDYCVHVFIGTNFCDLRREAAYELFELYYPECYAAWDKSRCDGFIFDTDRFLDSPSMSVQEIRFGEQAALLVSAE